MLLNLKRLVFVVILTVHFQIDLALLGAEVASVGDGGLSTDGARLYARRCRRLLIQHQGLGLVAYSIVLSLIHPGLGLVDKSFDPEKGAYRCYLWLFVGFLGLFGRLLLLFVGLLTGLHGEEVLKVHVFVFARHLFCSYSEKIKILFNKFN